MLGVRFLFQQTTKDILPWSLVRTRRLMFIGAWWLSHHALACLVSSSQLLRAAGTWRALEYFTSSLANDLRAPHPPSTGNKLRGVLASAAEPGTYRKVGHRGKMVEVGLPTVRTCSSFRTGIFSFGNHTRMPSAQPYLGGLGGSQMTSVWAEKGGEGISEMGCLSLETS